jgi:transposase
LSNGSTLLVGLEGIVVDTVTPGEDGSRVVIVGTAQRWVGKCPKCLTRSSRSKGWVTTRPRDIKIGPDRPQIVWRKRKWLCTNGLCERKSFTEATPAVPARAWMTTRTKSEMASAVLDDNRLYRVSRGVVVWSWVAPCRDWRVQAHRTGRRWLSGLWNPNAVRPTCLTMRL